MVGLWELCTGKLLFNHDAGSMIKYHKNLTSRGYRALIFRLISKSNVIYSAAKRLCFVSMVCSSVQFDCNEKANVKDKNEYKIFKFLWYES